MTGQSGFQGASFSNGPVIISQGKGDAGWDVRPVRHWDFTEGRLP